MVSLLGLFLLNLLMLWGLEKTVFWRQLLFWALGGALFYLAQKIGAKNLFSMGKKIYLLIVISLALPLLLGQIVRGSSRWITIAGFSFQPSEFAKPLLIGFLAWRLSEKEINSLKQFLLIFLTITAPVSLTLLQPDLGSAAIMFLTLAILILIARPKLNWWLLLSGIFCLGLLAGWNKFVHPYQISRIKSFLNPHRDPAGSGYNFIQAQMAIGTGGLFGRGFGQGRQTQLAYLPEKHTDFVFASLAEELGFLGVAFLLIFYFWFFSWLLQKTFSSKNKFVFYLRMGVFLQLLLQTAINIAMNLGLFPIVGLPLPLVSYGGSSLISTLFSLGLII